MRYYHSYEGLYDSEAEEYVIRLDDKIEDVMELVLNHIEKHYVKKVLVQDD